ncbi:MAG: nucleotide exchange factor GrpE [Planctomycetales bacterium]|nr:MAG: nucleotide exchange factor GrpE [Planctomycetales bacterium]
MADVGKLRAELSRLRVGVEQLRMPAIEAVGLDRTAEQLRSLEMKLRPLEQVLSSKEDESQIRRLFKDLLIGVDSLDRVFELMENQPGSVPQGVMTGLQSVYQLIQDTLSRHGLKQMQIGDSFDPHLHLAMGTEPHPGREDGKVSRILLKGYMFGDQVFRTAQVVVVKNSETNA